MTQVRVATPDDAPAILDLHVESIRAFGPAAYDDEQVAAWAEKDEATEQYPIEDGDHHLVVAERDGEVVGYGHLVPTGREVRAVYIHPDHARAGVGSTVLAHLEGYALGDGTVRLELWASLNAIGFYERMGYRPTGEETIEKEYDGRRVTLPVTVMEKSFGT
jgi:putative acetyltransferase